MSASRIRVKFLSKAQAANQEYGAWLSKFPGSYPSLGLCDFIFNQECQDYDWLAVYDDLPRRKVDNQPLWREKLACSRANTILITTEPSSIKLYGDGFLSQFGWILTSQEPWVIRHPRRIFRQAGLLWFYGNTGSRGNYDILLKSEPPEKMLDISTVCSSKQMRHTLHQARYDFTQALKKQFPEMAVFGQGVRPISDKADALDPYRYHVAVENHRALHHWTEKLTDPLLGYCLPFYYGAPNASDYIPEDSFIPIDIYKFEETCERIHRTIRDNEHVKRMPAIREARRKLIEEHSTFAQLSRLIQERHSHSTPSGSKQELLSRHAWRKAHPLDTTVWIIRKAAIQLKNFSSNNISWCR